MATRSILAGLLTFGLGMTGAAGIGLAAGKVGVAAAVKNSVTGSVGGALSAGSPVVELETISTGASSAAQLLFLDETTISLGPKAQIKLDKFVFDPNRKAGSVFLSASRGAFRFITGAQDKNNYKVKTPVATIGFRGTILDCLLVQKPLGLLCVLQEGGVDFDYKGKHYHLDTPGQMMSFSSAKGVQGPFASDGKLFDVAGGFAFPLYGGELDGVIKELTGGGDLQDIIDDFNSRDVQTPHGGGGGGGGGGGDDCPQFPNCDG